MKFQVFLGRADAKHIGRVMASSNWHRAELRDWKDLSMVNGFAILSHGWRKQWNYPRPNTKVRLGGATSHFFHFSLLIRVTYHIYIYEQGPPHPPPSQMVPPPCGRGGRVFSAAKHIVYVVYWISTAIHAVYLEFMYIYMYNIYIYVQYIYICTIYIYVRVQYVQCKRNMW